MKNSGQRWFSPPQLLWCFRKICTRLSNINLNIETRALLLNILVQNNCNGDTSLLPRCVILTFLKSRAWEIRERPTEHEWPDNTIGVYYLVLCLARLGLEQRGRLNGALSQRGAAPGFSWMPTCINHSFAEQSALQRPRAQIPARPRKAGRLWTK